MLNFKCKFHRGRSSSNRTDALIIVEVKGNLVTRVFARTIPNKLPSTMIPIICENVVSGSTIHTNEHRCHRILTSKGFVHDTVCHKYTFINPVTGVHTQSVESVNYLIKSSIQTYGRTNFLKEFCCFFNNKKNFVEKVLDLIRIF